MSWRRCATQFRGGSAARSRYLQGYEHGPTALCCTPGGPFGARLSPLTRRAANVRQQTERNESRADRDGSLIASGAASFAALDSVKHVSCIFAVRKDRS